MINLRQALSLGSGRGGWQKFLRALERGRARDAGHGSTRLREILDFGSNPGNLRMFGYRPPTLADNPALVVVLHGCTQTAAGYDLGAGWSTLADRYGFALLLPEQQRSNNPNGCFNWFQPEHSRRDQGEPLSIRQMIEKSVVDHGIDRRRVFITGLSAGGAMTSNMLACYPEVFAGGRSLRDFPMVPLRPCSKHSKVCIKVPPARHVNGGILYVKPRLTEGRGHASRSGMEMPTKQ